MEILHLDNGAKGCFFVEEKKKRLAEMHYVWSGENMIIDYTVIRDRRNLHRGYERHLMHEAVEFAKANGIHIIPLCPEAQRVMEQMPAYQEVVF
ncbi:MAG TPA: N-acetyltransferase [Chitinophagaceae bacterium]|nr:N-acetyltransferase [Chitinophagaceae bacterium]